MKKLSLYVLLGLMFCNVGFAETPKYDYKNLNRNIINGWKIEQFTMSEYKNVPSEIYTLTKGNWVLKCQILYVFEDVQTVCTIP